MPVLGHVNFWYVIKVHVPQSWASNMKKDLLARDRETQNACT